MCVCVRVYVCGRESIGTLAVVDSKNPTLSKPHVHEIEIISVTEMTHYQYANFELKFQISHNLIILNPLIFEDKQITYK